jgi:hypothetical protein
LFVFSLKRVAKTGNDQQQMAENKIFAWIMCCCSFTWYAAPKLLHDPAIANAHDTRSEHSSALLDGALHQAGPCQCCGHDHNKPGAGESIFRGVDPVLSWFGQL